MREPRYIEPNEVIESTNRTVQGRCLLRPDRVTEAEVRAALVRAAVKHAKAAQKERMKYPDQRARRNATKAAREALVW